MIVISRISIQAAILLLFPFNDKWWIGRSMSARHTSRPRHHYSRVIERKIPVRQYYSLRIHGRMAPEALKLT